MYSFSNNNNNNITNPIRNIPVYSFLYANTNVSSSPRKIMPKNLDTTLSSQSLQRNKWETNHKLNSDNLSSVYSLNSNGKNGNSGITLNNINTYDYNSSNNNKSNNSNFNELEHSTQKINSSEEISLSVNRRTQPGISAVIRSLAQNLKPNININGEDNTMADSNGSKTNTNDSYKVSDNNKHTEENKPETFSYFPTNSYSFPSHTGLPSVVSSLSRGIDNSWKNKRYSYTANHNTHSNGNYLNDNDVNNNSTLMRPNDENIKMNTTKPVQTTQCDSPLLTNSSVYDGMNSILQVVYTITII
ncbi:unnamed protein product [Heterobilharzia americana]|nr:unnamed protein product [Heterobilharzia americana]